MKLRLSFFQLEKSKKKKCKVLNPLIKNLPNPETLIDLKKSSLRTIKAIKNKEKIGIFGDYDVDGASASALLGNFFIY